MTDAVPRQTAFYIDTPDGAVFACLHAGQRSLGTGVLLCAPFGREALSAHLALKDLSDRFAAVGLPALRFDYLGHGDSDLDESQATLDLWVHATHAAADALKRAAAVDRLVIVGLRLGATAGWLAASTRTDVAAYVGIVPVVHGKSYLRELRALQAASPAPEVPAPMDMLESGGFCLAAAFRDEVHAVDLRRADAPPAPDVLWIERDDLPPMTEAVERLRALGAWVEHRRLGGYAGLTLNPQDARIPGAMWEEIVDAVGRRVGSAARRAVTIAAPGPRTARIGNVWESIETIAVRGGALQAVLSQPAGGLGSGRLVVWLNAGAVRRIGLSRLHVTLARRWAEQGHAVVRLDLAGLGDSEPLDGGGRNVVYASDAAEQVIDAVEALRARCQVSQVVLLGLCAGAYHALKAAVRGAQVDAVLAINPLTFFWHEGMSLDEPMQSYRVAEDFSRYRRLATSWRTWVKALRGRVDLTRLARVLVQRVAAMAHSHLRELGRLLRLQLKDDLAAELRQLLERKVRLHFVFAESDPGQALMREEGGRAVRRWIERKALGVTVIPDADHTFSRAGARVALSQHLDDVLLGLDRSQAKHGVDILAAPAVCAVTVPPQLDTRL